MMSMVGYGDGYGGLACSSGAFAKEYFGLQPQIGLQSGKMRRRMEATEWKALGIHAYEETLKRGFYKEFY